MQALAGVHDRGAGRRAPRGRRCWSCSTAIEDPQNVGAILRIGRRGRGARRHPAGAPCGAARRGDGQGVGRRRQPRADCDGRQHRARARGAEGTGRLDGRPRRLGRRSATTQVDYTLPTAFVLGAEGTGLAAAGPGNLRPAGLASRWRAQVASLNVSVSAGIALFEAARQRRPAGASRPRKSVEPDGQNAV